MKGMILHPYFSVTINTFSFVESQSDNTQKNLLYYGALNSIEFFSL